MGSSCRFALLAYAQVSVLPRSLHTSLIATLVIGFATLVRSVAFDRWITVLASLLLIGGATAALRGRTWGVALSLAVAAAFPVAWAVGIAPFWFVGVGVIGALPYVLSWDALARLDRRATVLLASMAASAGALVAVTWKLVAWEVFQAFPSLWPSRSPQHGLAVTALLTIGVIAAVVFGRRYRRQQVRVGTPDRVRVRQAAHQAFSAAAEAEAEVEVYEKAHAAIRRRH